MISQALRLQECPVEFCGPLPQAEMDESRIPVMSKKMKTLKAPLGENERSKMLVLASGRILDHRFIAALLMESSIEHTGHSLKCDWIPRNMFLQEILQPEEAHLIAEHNSGNSS